jgi:hypothetical protein
MGGSMKGENHFKDNHTAQQKLVTHEYITKQMQEGQFQNVEEDSTNHRKFYKATVVVSGKHKKSEGQ